MSLTPLQHQLLTFLADRLRTTGVCPSTNDMMAALGSRGRGNVHQMITILEQRGYLRRLFHQRSRCIEILRLPDDVSQHWLRTVTTGSIVRELTRRGIGPRTGPGYALCPHCGVERAESGAAVVEAGQRPMSSPGSGRAPPPVEPGRAPAAESVRGGTSQPSVAMAASLSFNAATARPRRLGAAT